MRTLFKLESGRATSGSDGVDAILLESERYILTEDFGRISLDTASVFVGPLDLYSTGVLVAYSLSRALSTAMLGENVVRLRRSSDDAEMDFPSGLVDGLVDQAAVTAWLAGANPFVVTAYDQSGNANDCLAVTEAQQPPYVANVVGGRAAIQATDIADPIGFLNGEMVYLNGGYTGFMVARGPSVRFYSNTSSPDDTEFNAGLGNAFGPIYVQAGADDAGIDSTDVLDTNWHICDGRGKFNDCDVFIDGVDVGTDEYSDGTGPVGVMTIPATRWRISGAASGTTCGCAELIIFGSFPSDPNCLLVRQNQQEFFGTPALP